LTGSQDAIQQMTTRRSARNPVGRTPVPVRPAGEIANEIVRRCAPICGGSAIASVGGSRGGAARVLVVDDDVEARDTLVHALHERGYRAAAADPAAAWQVRVSLLRLHLGPEACGLIHTVRGVGYVLRDDDVAGSP
jgi:hypothetical protein